MEGGRWVRVYRSLPLHKADARVERAFVMVHGTQRNGDDYFKTAVAATAGAGNMERTLVVAPVFRGNDGRRCKDKLESGELGFGCNGWKDGESARNGTADSFAVMDRLLTALDDRTVFPNLKELVVAGHSAGGQYVQRYAAVNRTERKLKAAVRYVVANPSSYLYLDSWRPVGNPCAGYNRYKYGLEDLSGYARSTGAETILAQYPKRNVTYLLGDRDVTDEHNLDKSCPAMAQGPNRFERGLSYHRRVTATFGARHALVKVPGCDHSADCMYGSEAGRQVVFGK